MEDHADAGASYFFDACFRKLEKVISFEGDITVKNFSGWDWQKSNDS